MSVFVLGIVRTDARNAARDSGSCQEQVANAILVMNTYNTWSTYHTEKTKCLKIAISLYGSMQRSSARLASLRLSGQHQLAG